MNLTEWRITQYIVSGPEHRLMGLANRLNGMEDLGSEYGRFWLGGIAALHLGLTADRIPKSFRDDSRGFAGRLIPGLTYCFSPLPQYGDPQMFHLDKGRREERKLRFSAITLWERKRIIGDYIHKNYPELEVCWATFDCCGQVQESYNPSGDLSLPWCRLQGVCCSGSVEIIEKSLRMALDYTVPEGLTEEYLKSEAFAEIVEEYNRTSKHKVLWKVFDELTAP